MVLDYTGVKVRLPNVAQNIDTLRQKFEKAVDAITEYNNTVGNLPTTYGEVIATIEAEVLADPTDEGWHDLKVQKDHHVEDFLALKAITQAAVNALAAL